MTKFWVNRTQGIMPLFFRIKNPLLAGIRRGQDFILAARFYLLRSCLALLLGTTLVPQSVVAQTDKPDFIADIPLMPDTELDTLRSVSFDTAGGRVLVLFIEIEAGETAIRSFYAQTLNALGWEMDGNAFTRRDEVLKLKPAPQAGDNIWKVTLSPRPLS